MNCEHCGAKMKDNDSVCPKCGKAPSVTRIYLSCRACGATLTQDDDAKVFRCPYCGAKQLLEESENVKLARINADKEKEKAKAAWFSFQDKLKESRIKLSVDYETSFIKHWTVILICIYLLMAIVSFTSDDYWIAGWVALVQAALAFVSWLMGKQIIHNESGQLRKIPLFISYILIIVFFLCWSGDVELPHHDAWPTVGVATSIPEPENKGNELEVKRDTQTEVYVSISGIPHDAQLAYIERCKEAGFTLDAETADSSYRAFNEDGYELDLTLYTNIEKMYVRAKAPTTLSAFAWPTAGKVAALPAPETTVGKVEYEYPERYEAILGEMDRDAFNAYVARWTEAGFNEKFIRNNNNYQGYNANGDYVDLEYIGLNRVSVTIRFKKPEETAE